MAYLTLFCRKFPKNPRKKSQRSGRGGVKPVGPKSQLLPKICFACFPNRIDNAFCLSHSVQVAQCLLQGFVLSDTFLLPNVQNHNLTVQSLIKASKMHLTCFIFWKPKQPLDGTNNISISCQIGKKNTRHLQSKKLQN